MRGAIAVLVLVLSGCMMDTREPVEPTCDGHFASCGENWEDSVGPWCADGRMLTGGSATCDDGVTVVCVGGGEPTCNPDGLEL